MLFNIRGLSLKHSVDAAFQTLTPLNCTLVQFSVSGLKPRHQISRSGAFFSSTSDLSYLLKYSIPTLGKILYAAQFEYYYYVYIRNSSEMPQYYTSHYLRTLGFSRLFQMGHQYALYSDMDSFVLRASAVPMESFLMKDLNIQQEESVCSGVILMKNTPWSRWFLRSWWDLGSTGCCYRADWDQNSFTWLVAQELQPFSKLPITLPLDFPSSASRAYKDLRNFTGCPNIHFVEMYAVADDPSKRRRRGPVRVPLVQLHNCLKQWKGCSSDSPALIYHTGGDNYNKVSEFAENATRTWIKALRWRIY
jgi:hypothetical protein